MTIDSDWAPRTAPGYLPVRFDITNLGDARVIEIVGQGIAVLSRVAARPVVPGRDDASGRRVRLARGDRVRFTMPVPIFGDNENIRFEIREDGRMLERFSYIGFQSRHAAPSDASALIVADSSSAFGRSRRNWRGRSAAAARRRLRRRHVASGTCVGDGPLGRTGAPGAVRRSISCSSRRACRPTGSGSRRFARSSSARRSGSS